MRNNLINLQESLQQRDVSQSTQLVKEIVNNISNVTEDTDALSITQDNVSNNTCNYLHILNSCYRLQKIHFNKHVMS